jgi:N-acetylglucosamine-6-phosphate deacetylase
VREIIARHYRDGSIWLIAVKGTSLERCERVADTAPGPYVLAPALLDIQVNGFAGVDVNGRSLCPKGLCRITQALAEHGVSRFCPTVITASPEDMRRALRTIAAAVARYPDVGRAVVGVHLEGPFLCRETGPRGAHPLPWIHEPDEGLFQSFQQAAAGLIRLVTLAPELPGAAAFIRARAAEGILVALGHTAAGEGDVQAAVDAGARMSTHLGNGCAQVLPRHSNPVTLQLGQDALAASFIADGLHLPPFLLKSFIRAKGIERSVLTTDCMAAAGAPPGRYTLGLLEMEVDADRVVRQPGQPNFAGSALTLDDAVANTIAWVSIPPADAIDMASLHPGRLLKVATEAAFEPGEDFILAEIAPRFAVTALFRGGVCVSNNAGMQAPAR